MVAPEDQPSLRELAAQLSHHPATTAQRQWDALGMVFLTLRGNEHELLTMIDAIESNKDNLGFTLAGNVAPRPARFRLQADLLRLTHNYVVSAATLIDHTRILSRKYRGTPVFDEYEARVADIRDAGLGPFVKKLRDFVTHVGVPAIGVQVHVVSGVSTEITTYIDRDGALAWKDWTAEARRYLQAQADKVPLRQIIRDYQVTTDTLYEWLTQQYATLHQADVEAFNELLRQTPWGIERDTGVTAPPN